MTNVQSIKVLPWGTEIYLEIPLHKKSANKFYARHAKNAEGREYIEFSKFGPVPNKEDETYSQKLRLFNPVQWVQLKYYVEGKLSQSIGWDLAAAEQEYVRSGQQERSARKAQTS